MQIEFHPTAEARLLEIWSYTEANWGEAQADVYVRELMDAIQCLSDPAYPRRSVADAQLPGIYFIRFRRHFIFFRQLPGGRIGVVNILHEAMDIPSRLKADVKKRG